MKEKPNVILIVLDTCRSDAIYPLEANERMPFLREFSKGCNVFPNSISPAAWTIPAHASIFTGLYPSRHGVIERVNGEIPNYSELYEKYEGVTLAESLKGQGYSTIGFSQNLLIAPDTSFSRGFDEFFYTHNMGQDTYFRMLENYNKLLSNYGSSINKLLPKIINPGKSREFISLYRQVKRDTKWLQNTDLRDKGGNLTINRIKSYEFRPPFFLFLNLMEMHDPHDRISLNFGWSDSFFKNSRPSPEQVRSVKDSYFNASKTVDKLLSDLIEFLSGKGFLENSILLITSDHGQALMEHDYFFGHGNFLYDEIIKVPLLIRLPNGQKIEVNNGYQSTTRIKPFIENFIQGNPVYDSFTEEFAFSECFGTLDKDVEKYRDHPKYKEVMKRIDIPRTAVYYKDKKLVMDMESKKVEEFKSFSEKIEPQESSQILEEMKGFISIFN